LSIGTKSISDKSWSYTNFNRKTSSKRGKALNPSAIKAGDTIILTENLSIDTKSLNLLAIRARCYHLGIIKRAGYVLDTHVGEAGEVAEEAAADEAQQGTDVHPRLLLGQPHAQLLTSYIR
jgi:hypothetical protein